MTRSILIIVIALSQLAAGCSVVSAQPPARPSAIGQCSRRTVPLAPAVGVLASDGSRVFVGYVNGSVESLAVGSLESNWRAELGGEFASDLALIENSLAIVTNRARDPGNPGDMSTVRLLSKETGVTAWAVKVAFSDRYYLGKINGSLAIVSKEGQITLLDRSSGQVQSQSMPLGTLTAPPAFSPSTVAIATADKYLTVISAQGGRVISRQPTDFVTKAVAFIKKDVLALGDERGNVTLSGAESNKTVWRFKSGAAVSSVTEIDQGILVTSLDNFVYLLSDYNGDVKWKRRLTGRVLEGGLSVNGHLIVLVNSENSAYVIDIDQGKLTDSVSAFEKDLISRGAVRVGERAFALATVDSVEVYSLGGCEKK